MKTYGECMPYIECALQLNSVFSKLMATYHYQESTARDIYAAWEQRAPRFGPVAVTQYTEHLIRVVKNLSERTSYQQRIEAYAFIADFPSRSYM